MLLDAAVLTIALGLIGRGRLGRLKDFDLRAPSLFIFAAMAQIAVTILGARGAPIALKVGGPLQIATYLLLLVGLWLNRHMRGMWVVGVGVVLNFAVIAANGGSMPVDRALAVRAGNQAMVNLLDSPTYTNHEPVTGETRLKPLADVLPLPLLLPRPRFFSPGSVGDVFVTVGACWLILRALGAFGLGGKQEGTAPEAGGGGAG